MVNSEEFVKRLEKILDHYGLTASAFADQVGVQRSGISHLLSGRNKPSLEFVLKLISTFPEVNLYWLLNGKGSFPSSPAKERPRAENTISTPEVATKFQGREIEKVIIFYKDGSFEAYQPGADTG